MINYRLKDSVVTHFPAIFKGLGSKPSVIHMALDVELHGGMLAARVAGGRPIECGKWSRGVFEISGRHAACRKSESSRNAADYAKISEGRTIWIADAHRDDEKRFVMHADEKLSAFLELERVARKSLRFQMSQ
jgi:hypothetical protein